MKIIDIYKRFEDFDPKPHRIPVKVNEEDAFETLIGTILSSQTKDERTAAAVKKLFRVIKTPQELVDLSIDEITELIQDVGMYNKKAIYIKTCSQQLIDWYDGKVPSTRKELMSLMGVGRKVSDIVLHYSFGELNVAVDTHVHRVSNRLGIAATNNADKTADILMRDTPEEYLPYAHEWLINHGRVHCDAKKPKCETCPLKDLCDYYNQEGIYATTKTG